MATTPSTLANTERFFYFMSSIPRVSQRLSLLLFKEQHGILFGSVEESLAAIEAAERELNQSKSLRLILSVILAFGNYLNGESKVGGAYGFKLSALNRLVNLRSNDKSTSLMTYLVEYVHKQYPQADSWYNEIGHVRQSVRIEASQLRADLNRIKNSLSGLQAELNIVKSARAPGDRFPDVMSSFCQDASVKLARLLERFDAAEKEYKRLRNFYGETSDLLPWEKFFNMFVEFANQFQAAQAAIVSVLQECANEC